MISEARSEAARRNGAKSNGPKTPEGKAISSANSLRHGMTAKAILLTSENPEAYTKLAEAYYVKFRPADDVECDLIDEMVIAKWRQRRDWSNEAALFDLEMDHQTKKVDSEYTKIDHACRYAIAFRALADQSKSIQLLTRYETSHRRSYYKALTTLLQLRAAPNPKPGPVESPAEPAEPPAPPETEPSKSEPQPSENNVCETNPASNERGTNNAAEATTNDENTTSGDGNSPNDRLGGVR